MVKVARVDGLIDETWGGNQVVEETSTKLMVLKLLAIFLSHKTDMFREVPGHSFEVGTGTWNFKTQGCLLLLPIGSYRIFGIMKQVFEIDMFPIVSPCQGFLTQSPSRHHVSRTTSLPRPAECADPPQSRGSARWCNTSAFASPPLVGSCHDFQTSVALAMVWMGISGAFIGSISQMQGQNLRCR